MLTDRRSLIEASKTRSGVADTTVYARGMLAAFLTDLELLKRSGGKESVSTLLRSIFKKYNDAALETDANSAILTAIASPKIARFVNGSESMNWADELSPAGIEVSSQPGLTDLKVTNKQSNSQKKLLDKLGYNNWRRSPVIPK
jgi:predicted metalloprotease with PDZ domain